MSSREEVIGTNEFSHTNGTLMQAEGTLHPTNDKSSVIHLLEGLVYTVTASDEASSSGYKQHPGKKGGGCLECRDF